MRTQVVLSPMKLVENKVVTFEEFFKGAQFPTFIIDIVSFLNEELKTTLKKENKYRFISKSITKEMDREFSNLNKTLLSNMNSDNFEKFLDYSDYFLDEIKPTILSDYRYLLKKGNSRTDSILLLMKRLCEIGVEINNEFYKEVSKRLHKNIEAPVSKGHSFIYSRILKLISDGCTMKDHKFNNLTNKIKNVKIEYDKGVKRSCSIDLQKIR